MILLPSSTEPARVGLLAASVDVRPSVPPRTRGKLAMHRSESMRQDQLMYEDEPTEAWMPNADSQVFAARVFREDLEPPNLDSLRNWIVRGGMDDDRANSALYDDALYDLTKLLEEFRYEAAVACLYSTGLREEIGLLASEQHEGLNALGLPVKVRALLSGYAATPSPIDLFRQPAEGIPGLRILGGWWAAQLYDSALLRGMSVLDRLMTLLYCVDGQIINSKSMPSFRAGSMRGLLRWAERDEWIVLRELLGNPIFESVKSYRDGLVHRRREPMELHGDHVVGGWNDDGTNTLRRGGAADMHLVLVLDFYKLIMLPAFACVSALIDTDS